MKHNITVILSFFALVTTQALAEQEPYLHLSAEYRIIKKGVVLDCTMSLASKATHESIGKSGLIQDDGVVAPDICRTRFINTLKAESLGVQHIGPVAISILGTNLWTDILTVKVVEKFDPDDMFITVSQTNGISVGKSLFVTIEYFFEMSEGSDYSKHAPKLNIIGATVEDAPGQSYCTMVTVDQKNYARWFGGFTVIPQTSGTMTLNMSSVTNTPSRTSNEIRVSIQ